MSVNAMGFEQSATILNALYMQVTGKNAITITDESDFISVATVTMQSGVDAVGRGLSQVLSKSIFSTRPYTAKLKGLQVDNQKYGAITRKVTAVDKPFEQDERIPLTDGTSVDPQRINKPATLQVMFYGTTLVEKTITMFKDQLDAAMESSAAFGSYVAMVLQNVYDMLEQKREIQSRMTLNNLIAGIIEIGNTNQVVHLLTEYNAETGLSLTKQDVFKPANVRAFGQWAYARLETLMDFMAERTVLYHQNVTGSEVARHTDRSQLNSFMLSKFGNIFKAAVQANTFNETFLKGGYAESVSYWQSPDAPDSIKVKPSYMKADGTIDVPANAVEQDDIVAVFADKEAAGLTLMNQWSASEPFNAHGGYQNTVWHETIRYWNDFTENAIVVLLD